ncbi:MAG: nucleotidyltransferase domain-containing protein [Armatimonadetes bacterium]|nr:nucleotidyltransferase domain-containing protein [Armatimonadota bacterium]
MKSIDQAHNISEVDKQLLADLKRTVLERLPDATLLLYGSAARGEREPESDYDVLVLTSRTLTTAEKEMVGDAVYDLELAHEAVICTIFVSNEQWNLPLMVVSPFHRNVEREAIRL